MHIDNFSSLEEIIKSKPWEKFYDVIINNPIDAPRTCKECCNKNKKFEDIDGREIRFNND